MDNVKLFNVVKFNEYSELQKHIFEAYKSAQMILFPKWEGDSWDDETISDVEKSAFIFTDNFPIDLIMDMVDEKIKTAMPTPTASNGIGSSLGKK